MNIVRWILTTAVENPEIIPPEHRILLSHNFGWGPACETQRANGRSGYCSFQIRHLFAVHSFGQYALEYTSSPKASIASSIQLVTVERDGLTRNSLSFKVAANLAGKGPSQGINACMYQVVCTPGADNICGVPHSLISRAENLIIAPNTMYWESGILAPNPSPNPNPKPNPNHNPNPNDDRVLGIRNLHWNVILL